MQNLSNLTHEIDFTQRTLRGLRDYQRKLDSQSYSTPDDVVVLASKTSGNIPKISQFLYERFIEERKAALESLPDMIERASLALCVAQAEIELAWRENQTSGLSECIKSNEAFVHTLFFAAARRKESLVEQKKLHSPVKESTEEELRLLQHDILNVLSSSRSLNEISDQELLETVFILRRSFVESCLKHVNSQSKQVGVQHRHIDMLIVQAQSGTASESSAVWTDIEKERRESHRSLLASEQAMRRIEEYMESFFMMGATSPTQRDFPIVRYVPAPLNLLEPKIP